EVLQLRFGTYRHHGLSVPGADDHRNYAERDGVLHRHDHRQPGVPHHLRLRVPQAHEHLLVRRVSSRDGAHRHDHVGVHRYAAQGAAVRLPILHLSDQCSLRADDLRHLGLSLRKGKESEP
ncbi:hypothetical protein BX600DRAFT_550490, partial [Xylariales sp. PMI_506]